MTGDALQRIAAAVTPAVMVSACGLIALGLDNQASRMAMRLRELAGEHRREEGADRRPHLREQVAILGRRHRLIARALLLDYAALLAFVATSLLSLAQGLVPIPAEVPFLTFLAGVLGLGAMAVFAILAVNLAGAALRLEQREVLRDGEGEAPLAAGLRRPAPTRT
ncbi:DUF2721 domain-containing protein [Anaeromyxobacter paludicola]|uniref:DUF2721 domain-containing protein n=1 Tax=Anaeromyxobacter paludicola TaxID=2918171 RepID=A0ABN6N893_9BACT|nr:DUF2721 domain-containing protein [Anaeromyxobacter paludicola]BDG08068.1 hypothetical protein AMPC_11810 [Anaeromyxobacter paludicola]